MKFAETDRYWTHYKLHLQKEKKGSIYNIKFEKRRRFSIKCIKKIYRNKPRAGHKDEGTPQDAVSKCFNFRKYDAEELQDKKK